MDPVLDLYASRMLAHREAGGPIADASSVAFVRSIRGGWKNAWLPNRELDGERIAFVAGLAGALDLPVGAHIADRVTMVEVDLKPFLADQKLTIVVNGKSILNTTLAIPRWQRVRAPIPADIVKPGENEVRLHFAATRPVGLLRIAAAVRWVRLATADAPPIPDEGLAALAVAAASVGAESLRAFRLNRGGVAFYFQPPPGARLDLRLGIADRPTLEPPAPAVAPGTAVPPGTGGATITGSAGAEPMAAPATPSPEPPTTCAFVVRVETDGGPPRELYRGEMEGPSGRWVPAQADLSDFADRAIRLELSTEGNRCDGAMIAEPMVSRPLPAGSATAATPAVDPATPPPAHIVLWLVDSMRADRISPYAATRVRTPGFSGLSREGALFLNASSVASESRAVAASLFTGTYPASHGMVAGAGKLAADLPTLPELLSAAGYTTAGFIGSGFLSAADGFDRGFDVYRNFIRDGKPTDAEGIWSTAKEWLAEEKPERSFLYLHHVDPHVPWRAHEELISIYDPLPYTGLYRSAVTGHHLAAYINGHAPFLGRDRERAIALYDNEVAFNDQTFTTMLADLAELGMADETLIIVTSDHGEELWDHGSVGHAQTLYEEVLHTPLVWRRLGAAAAPETRGRVVREPVETIDLLPTLLHLVGAPVPETLQGESFASLTLGRPGLPASLRVTYSAHLDFWRAVRVGRYKCHIRGLDPRLYDLDEDPTEITDRWAELPVAARTCADPLWLMVRFGDRWRRSEFGSAAAHTEAFATLAESGVLP